MFIKNQRIITKCEDGSFDFFDEPEWGEEDWDVKNPNIVGWYYIEQNINYHDSGKSALYDDLTGWWHDDVTIEDSLPDERFVVAYFKHASGWSMEQLVDYDISKEEIIANVKNQKYVEGAYYYLLRDMKEITDIAAYFINE